MIKISPSILAADFSRLGDEIAAMEQAGCELLHLDVMDGRFVPNISFGAPVIKSLRKASGLVFDVHLMLSEPLRYIGDFVRAGAELVTFHLESESDAGETLAEILSHGVKAGLAVKPGTPAEAVFPWLDRLSMALVMTVEPGFGGQSFMGGMLPKIRAIRSEIIRRGLAVDVEVDGGIDETTAPLVAEAGANILVAGSSLFSQKDYGEAVRNLRNAVGS